MQSPDPVCQQVLLDLINVAPFHKSKKYFDPSGCSPEECAVLAQLLSQGFLSKLATKSGDGHCFQFTSKASGFVEARAGSDGPLLGSAPGCVCVIPITLKISYRNWCANGASHQNSASKKRWATYFSIKFLPKFVFGRSECHGDCHYVKSNTSSFYMGPQCRCPMV